MEARQPKRGRRHKAFFIAHLRIAKLEAALADRDRRLAELERLVEELRRGGKRQAAPFSKGGAEARSQAPWA
jgi:hypothetical protein